METVAVSLVHSSSSSDHCIGKLPLSETFENKIFIHTPLAIPPLDEMLEDNLTI